MKDLKKKAFKKMQTISRSKIAEERETDSLNDLFKEEIMIDLKVGNVSNTYKGAVQRFSASGETLQVSFKAYD